MTFQQRVSGGIEYLERPATGAGPVIVLLHGIGSGAESFSLLPPLLPADCRLLAWNAPGYGASEPLPEAWPLASAYAATLKGLVERLALDRFFLVGHSLGCLMAAAFATTYAEQVRGLLLASPAVGHNVLRGGTLSPAAQARIDDLARLGPEAFAETRSPRLVFQPETNADVLVRVRDGMARVRAPGYPQAARMLASGALLADAAKLNVPTDVVVGAEDVVTPPEAAQNTYEALPQGLRGRFTLIPATGHAIYQQAPARFASALMALVQRSV